AAVPIVERTDDANTLRVGRPHGKAGSGHAVDNTGLRAELIVNAAFVALAEKVEVHLAEGWKEGVGIAGPSGRACVIADDQIIGVNAIGFFRHAFEQS